MDDELVAAAERKLTEIEAAGPTRRVIPIGDGAYLVIRKGMEVSAGPDVDLGRMPPVPPMGVEKPGQRIVLAAVVVAGMVCWLLILAYMAYLGRGWAWCWVLVGVAGGIIGLAAAISERRKEY